MTSSLTVIGLVARLKVTTQTVYGDAMYRDQITNENTSFTIKQFVNGQHEYNVSFKEGDLVIFGGKFTLDQKKIMVNIIFCFYVNKNSFIKNYYTYFFFFCINSLLLKWQ